MSAARACNRSAVAYIRLTEPSEDLVRDVSETPRVQRAAIESWARRENVQVRSWQVDLGIGGTTPIAERPGLVGAYRALREHGANMLVAAKADRFAQDALVCWLIERAALTQGATIHTADEPLASSPPPSVVSAAAEPGSSVAGEEHDVGWTRGAMKLARAYDSVMIRSKIRAALAAKRTKGERIGTVPYGYRLNEDGVHVEPDAEEQAVVATVCRLTSEGLSQRAIVAHLAACGVTGRTGAPLRQTQVANILRSAST